MTSDLVHELDHGLRHLVRFGSVLDDAGLPAGIDVSVSESIALRHLRIEPQSQQQLGDYLGLEKSTVSRLVDSLHTKGWVSRSTDPSNGRVRIVALSDEGSEVAGHIDDAMLRVHSRMIERLTDDERAALEIALPALVRAMSAPDPR